MPFRENPISAVMIVKDELHHLKRNLPRLEFCDEIVVVDSGSTDGSVEFAESLGCRVLHRAFDGYGTQKAFAVDQARFDWVVNVDADEYLPEPVVREIEELISDPPAGLNAIFLRSRLHFLGREFRFGRESGYSVLRVFRKSCGNFDRSPVHERVVIADLKAVTLASAYEHHSYPSIEHYVDKMNRYTSAGAAAVFRRHSWCPARLRALLFPFKFIQFYFLQLNFLNGWPGFVWSVLSCHAFFIKYVKVFTLQSEEGGMGWLC